MLRRRECQSIPIERSSIFDLPDQNPPLELRPEMGIVCRTRAVCSQELPFICRWLGQYFDLGLKPIAPRSKFWPPFNFRWLSMACHRAFSQGDVAVRDAELSLARFKISDELERSWSGATVSEDKDGNQLRTEHANRLVARQKA